MVALQFHHVNLPCSFDAVAASVRPILPRAKLSRKNLSSFAEERIAKTQDGSDATRTDHPATEPSRHVESRSTDLRFQSYWEHAPAQKPKHSYVLLTPHLHHPYPSLYRAS